MKQFSLAIFCTVIFISCENRTVKVEPSGSLPQNQGNAMIDSVAVVSNNKNNNIAKLETYMETDSSGILIFPLRFAPKENIAASISKRSDVDAGYWNVAFYNTKTGEQKLLTESKVLITNINKEMLDEQNLKSLTSYIFYEVVSEDFNKDGKFTNEDARYLFISERSGNNFLSISPAGKNVLSWKYLKPSGKILMTVQTDSNKNGKFEEDDETSLYTISLQTGTSPEEAFSEAFKNKLKVLYAKQWMQ